MGTFWTFLKLLPEFISIATDVGNLIASGVTWAEIQLALRSFKIAEKKASDTKDTSDLEKKFHGG